MGEALYSELGADSVAACGGTGIETEAHSVLAEQDLQS